MRVHWRGTLCWGEGGGGGGGGLKIAKNRKRGRKKVVKKKFLIQSVGTVTKKMLIGTEGWGALKKVSLESGGKQKLGLK